jgi:hypothetical protein
VLRRRASVAILGVALWQGRAGAQDTTRTPPPPRRTPAQERADSLRRDSLLAVVRQDSIARESRRLREERQRADSIKVPVASAEMPVLASAGTPLRWNRESLFASGALALGELVDFVPGTTVFRTGWMGSPHAAAFMGAFRRVRVFYEGIELDPLDPRTGGIHDLSFIDTWQLEDARIEQAADEVRIHLSSWRVRSTTPATRVDFATGDLETNSYRGYYGRRLSAGHMLQLGAHQYSTSDERNAGDVQQLSLWARFGWAKKKWSVDASLLSNDRERAEQLRLAQAAPLPRLDGTLQTVYARVAYGDPAADGVWLQGLASRQKMTLHIDPFVGSIDSVTNPAAPDTTFVTDSAASRPQYVFTGGVRRGPLRLSAVARLRTGSGDTDLSPGARASFETGPLTLAFYGEHSPSDGVVRLDATGRILLLPWLAVSGAVGRRDAIEGSSDPGPATMAARGEVGVRLGRMWATAGLMTRDTASLPAPVVFDKNFQPALQGRTTGTFATLRGRFWQDVGLDAWAIRHGDAGIYRPQYQSHSRLYFDSGLLRRFPSGNLNILAAITHEYRSYAFFPTSETELLRSSQYRTWGLLLEIRLLNATLTYQFRNFLLSDYTQVPGFRMPRPVNFYGIRWNFYD